MTLISIHNTPVNEMLISRYMHKFIDKIFKILPMIENNEKSVIVYMESLQAELEGYEDLFKDANTDPMLVSLLSILQWLRESVTNSNQPYKRIRREVFHAISVCKKLEDHYSAYNANEHSTKQEVLL